MATLGEGRGLGKPGGHVLIIALCAVIMAGILVSPVNAAFPINHYGVYFGAGDVDIPVYSHVAGDAACVEITGDATAQVQYHATSTNGYLRHWPAAEEVWDFTIANQHFDWNTVNASIRLHCTCNSGGTYCDSIKPAQILENWYNMSDWNIVTPDSSFSCVPTSQYPDTDVVCTDTSTNTPTSWYWSIDAEALGIKAWQSATTRNFTWQSHYPGLYTVNHQATNSAGSDWYNLTNYISISANATPNTCSGSPASGYIRSMVQCVDSQTSGAIHGCAISIKDQEGGAWSNTSSAQGGTHCIDTLPAHHISAYGSMSGYTSTYRLDLLASSSIMYELLMVPGYVPPAASGKVWVYVLANDGATGAPLSGALVTLSGTGQATQSGYTDNIGSLHKQWANVSTAYITVSKTGYSTISKTLTTTSAGPDTIRFELYRGTTTPTATSTTGPGGTVPTTIGPYGTPGASGTMAPGYTNNEGQKMMDFLAANGMNLVQLCFIMTILGLVGFKK